MSHLNIKPFHCKFCTYTSNKKTNLTTHLERVHDSKTVEADIVIEEEEMRRMGRLREKLAASPKGIFRMDDNGNISLVGIFLCQTATCCTKHVRVNKSLFFRCQWAVVTTRLASQPPLLRLQWKASLQC